MSHIQRNEATKRIKKALKNRTGLVWSVTGSTGTAWGWITIQAPKARRVAHDPNPAYDIDAFSDSELAFIERTPKLGETAYYTSREDAETLAKVMGLDQNVSGCQGISISPESRDFYLNRAEYGP